MRTFLILTPLLLGLGITVVHSSARASEPGTAKVFLPLDAKERGEFLQGPIENAKTALAEVNAHVETLDETATKDIHKQAAFVARTCPYNGSIIEVVQVLNDTLRQIDHPDVATVSRGIAEHWKLLKSLDVTTGNGLSFTDAPSLTKHLATVPKKVDALSKEEKDAIHAAVTAVNAPTADLWVSKMMLIHYRNALQPVQEGPAAIPELVQMLDALIALYGC